MMNGKNLLALIPGKNTQKKKEEENSFKSNKKVFLTYFQSGYGDSVDFNGNPEGLHAGLNDKYQKFKQECIENEEKQKALQQSDLDQKSKIEQEVKKKDIFIELREEEISRLQQKIEETKDSLSGVRNDPEKYGVDADKRPKAQFYLGLIVMIPITLYLCVFYISASYSAFFKEFETTELVPAIFDAQTLSKAWNDGILELIFVLTIPFAFMGLGYLIHMFSKNGGWVNGVKIAALMITTFIFDAILAYQIENSIYNLEKTLNTPPFNLSIAFQSIQFWGIIFAGFVVYIIWGLILDFVMKEYENIDKIKQFIREQLKLVKRHESDIQSIRQKIDDAKLEKTSLESKLLDVIDQLNKNVIPQNEYLLYYTEYVKGWLKAISKELILTREAQKELFLKCKEAALKHLADVGISIDGSSEVNMNELFNSTTDEKEK